MECTPKELDGVDSRSKRGPIDTPKTKTARVLANPQAHPPPSHSDEPSGQCLNCLKPGHLLLNCKEMCPHCAKSGHPSWFCRYRTLYSGEVVLDNRKEGKSAREKSLMKESARMEPTGKEQQQKRRIRPLRQRSHARTEEDSQQEKRRYHQMQKTLTKSKTSSLRK